MKPVVSILILTHNRLACSSQYIPHIVENAGDIPFEVLIWDNASNDGSYDWVCSFGQANSHVYQTFGSDTNIGMEAFNTLAEQARGEFIIKVDDDVSVPRRFAERLVSAYKRANEEKLLYLGWDMSWGQGSGGTFAMRSGRKLYQNKMGKMISFGVKDNVMICYYPSRWMVNGVCRLSRRDKFLEVGGHPQGIIYGVDSQVSRQAEKHGYWIGYYCTEDLVHHRGTEDTGAYRAMKNKELHRAKGPLKP